MFGVVDAKEYRLGLFQLEILFPVVDVESEGMILGHISQGSSLFCQIEKGVQASLYVLRGTLAV